MLRGDGRIGGATQAMDVMNKQSESAGIGEYIGNNILAESNGKCKNASGRGC